MAWCWHCAAAVLGFVALALCGGLGLYLVVGLAFELRYYRRRDPMRTWKCQPTRWPSTRAYRASILLGGANMAAASAITGVLAFLVSRGGTTRLYSSWDAHGPAYTVLSTLGYILAIHPDATIGNCEHLNQASQGDYAECYERYSAWSATWADRVRKADVTVGSCEVRAAPAAVRRSNSEWPVWWVPLRHIGGLPRQYFTFVMAVDSRACAAARIQ